MIEWRRVPWPLWVFVALTTLVVIGSDLRLSGPVSPRLVAGVVTVAWMFLLLASVRWVWIATVAFNILVLVINLAIVVIAHGAWYQFALLAAISAVYIGLLLLPATSRFFAKPKAVSAP